MNHHSSSDLSSEQGKEERKDVPGSKNKKTVKIAVCVILAVFLVLLLVSGTIIGIFYHYYSLMNVSESDADYYSAVSVTDQTMEEFADANVELPEEDIYSDSRVINILLIGTDERTEKFDPYARADSMMVLSLNKKTHSVKLVSLERGMTIKMPGNRYDLLTHTFHYGGAKLVMQTVRTHFNLDVDRYIRVNFFVFQKLVDQVGGVDVTLTAAEANALNEILEKKVTEGRNHLDGSSALQYARLRSIDSDWHRIERQRNVIASVKNSMKGQSVGELNEMATTCLPYVRTNLTSTEFADLLLNVTKYANGDFDQMTIPQKGTYHGLGDVDFAANSEILRKFLYDQ